MQPPEYTLDHAAEKIGMRTAELLAAAEVGEITLVYVIRRDSHAPIIDGRRNFSRDYFNSTTETMESEILNDSRLRIVVYMDDVPKLAAGERFFFRSGYIYKDQAVIADRSCPDVLWGKAFGRRLPLYGVDTDYSTDFQMATVTLEDLRVPAEEIERITQRPRAAAVTGKQSDQQKSQTAKVLAPIKPRTRVQRNRAAVEAARAELMKEKHREPTTDEVFFFLENDPSGTFVDVKNDTLLWEDSQGKTHSMTRRALEKMLSIIRNPT